MMTLLRAINTLESACLSSDSTKTTEREILTTDTNELRRYYNWLRLHAPDAAMSLPLFDDFEPIMTAKESMAASCFAPV